MAEEKKKKKSKKKDKGGASDGELSRTVSHVDVDVDGDGIPDITATTTVTVTERREVEVNLEGKSQEELVELLRTTEKSSIPFVIDMDKGIADEIKAEVNKMDEELRDVNLHRTNLERSIEKDEAELAKLIEEEKLLEAALGEEKYRLGILNDDRRGLNFESLGLGIDREHYLQELEWMENMRKEEGGSLDALKKANEYISRSTKDMEQHTGRLEENRRELIGELAVEQGKLKSERLETREMRVKLEQMRRDQAEALKKRERRIERDLEAEHERVPNRGPVRDARMTALGGVYRPPDM